MSSFAEDELPQDVRQWFENNQLSDHKGDFVRNGYRTLAAISEMNGDDLERCGIEYNYNLLLFHPINDYKGRPPTTRAPHTKPRSRTHRESNIIIN